MYTSVTSMDGSRPPSSKSSCSMLWAVSSMRRLSCCHSSRVRKRKNSKSYPCCSRPGTRNPVRVLHSPTFDSRRNPRQPCALVPDPWVIRSARPALGISILDLSRAGPAPSGQRLAFFLGENLTIDVGTVVDGGKVGISIIR